MRRLHLIVYSAAAAVVSSLVVSDAHAQSIFCPSTVSTQIGIHYEGNECTNGNTGAYSNAALAAQALTDLSQASTQDSTKATMAGISNRRTAEEERCPDGSTRIGGVCRRTPATPFAPESALRTALPDALLSPDLQAYASLPVKAFAPPPPRSPIATWVQAYGDYERRTGRANGLGEFSVLTLDATSTAVTGGTVGGIDATFRNVLAPGDGFIVGLLAGYSSAKIKVTTNSMSASPISNPGGLNTLDARLSGGGVGGYASYFKGGFSSDFAFKADFLDLDITSNELLGFGANPALGIPVTFLPFSATGATRLNSYTLSWNVNYKIPVNAAVWVQPTAGVQYTRSDYDASAIALGLEDGYLVRLQGGARVGIESIWGMTPVTATFTGLLYDNVVIRGGAIQAAPLGNPLILNDEGKIRAQGIAALNFLLGGGVSSFIQGEVRGGDGLFGVAGKGGVRVAW